MKPCDPRWREQLVDHALGRPASAALAEHLVNCAPCSAALQDWKAQMGKIDATIRQMAVAEPPANSATRVVAEVRRQNQHSWLRRWEWQTAAMGLTVLVMGVFAYEWNLRRQHEEAEKALSAASAIGNWKSPTEGLLRTPSDQWLKTPPKLGKYFYQLNAAVPQKERENP